jgi:hypothetical protein
VAGAYSQEQEPKIINSEDMLRIWLNGDRFHPDDKEKRKILDGMHGIMPEESSVALFLFLITDKIAAILALQRMVALFAGEREEIFAEFIIEEPIYYHAFIHASIAQFAMFDLDKDDPRPLPQEGEPFAQRVFDLTHMGPTSFHQFLDPVGQLWMHGKMIYEIGEHRYFFRVAPGFRTENGKVSKHGTDIIATFKVIAFLIENPFSEMRRKPAQTTLERMQAAKEGKASTKVVLKAIETKDELDKILNREPRPKVEYIVVPRPAFMFAYWPISKQARERFHRLYLEGNKRPTFEEVEGTDIFRAWEISEEEERSEPGEE